MSLLQDRREWGYIPEPEAAGIYSTRSSHNCEGVEAEGQKHGFTVLRVDHSDARWTETILHYLNGKSR